MKRSLVLIALLVMCAACTAAPGGQPDGESDDQARSENPPAARLGPPPTVRVLTTGLDHPWELIWGPDDFLWITERVGKRVARINPADGTRSTVLTIPDVADGSDGQQGLLGLAFGHRAVYLAYSYGPEDNLRGKIVRYSYDQAAATLRDPVDVITDLPASDDHNSGRLLFGPDQKLYYSIGDQGHNKSDNACEPIRAQDLPTAAQVVAKDWSTYQGKVLRLDPDGSIPEDNPVIRGVRSHVFTYGHRNPQGLAFGPGGLLLSAEHGPKSDDEINLLRPGANYGWPFVAGFRDNQSYWYADWSAAPDCAQLDHDDYQSPPSVPRGPRELEWNAPNYTEPLKTLYTVPTGHNFADDACEEDMDHLCWPTIAPSSLDYLPAENAANPALANALILTSLKNGALYVAKLTQDGSSVQGDVRQLFRTRSRYRDAVAAPDGTKIYILTDSEGPAGPGSESESGELHSPGSIVEFTLTVPGGE